jgi:hypothetical protein
VLFRSLLLHVRGLIFGNDIQFSKDDKKITISLNDIIDFYNNLYSKYEYNHDGVKYTFDYVRNFKYPSNKISFIIDSLRQVDDEDIKNIDDIKHLPAFNFNNIFDNIIEYLYIGTEYNISILGININIMNCIVFLKSIFSCDLMELYELEYTLRKYLNFNNLDLTSTALPECRILLNLYIKDMKQQEDKMNKLKN